MYVGPLRSLVDELGHLPGIGPKSAQRIAFHLLKVSSDDAMRLAEAIVAVKEKVTSCSICFNVRGGRSLRVLLRSETGRLLAVRGGGSA